MTSPSHAAPEFPGAVAPERQTRIAPGGIELQLHEWGDPEGIPVVLCHGMFDHGRGFDTLAPLLAEHFRVIAVDARGHGDSGWADAYTWPADLADLADVLAWAGPPVHLVGHSRGGGQALDVAAAVPERVRKLVDIDGFGPPPEGFIPPGREGMGFEGTRVERFQTFLNRRRRAADGGRWRPYPSLEDLVERRQAQNPRLGREWLRYFLWHGSRQVEGGWVWKADPLAPQGFGPWRPDWVAIGWRQIQAPLLAVTGSEADSWGPLPEPVLTERLANVKQVERAVVEGTGHFVHMEKPRETATLLLDFLRS